MVTTPATQAAKQEKADEQKPDETKPEEGQRPADETAEEPSKAKVLVFDPKVKATLNSTQHTITKTQLVEAGVKDPFKDKHQTEVVWDLGNRYRVPASQFSESAIKRLVKEADISIQDEE